MFYKVLMGEDIIDVLNGLQCCKYNKRSKMVLRCTERESPDGIISERLGRIYCVDDWGTPSDVTQYDGVVHLVAIDEDTYKEMSESLASGGVPMDGSLYEQVEQEEQVEQKLTAAQVLKNRLETVEGENAQLKEDLQKTQDMLKELYAMVMESR